MPKDILSELGYTYGSLNPIQKKKSQPIYSTNSDPLEILRKEMADRFKNDGMKGVTRFKAIVLRIENPIGEDKESAMSWADALSSLFGSEEEIHLVSIKAMIPELHGSILPTPVTLGTEDGVGADHKAINRYPTFTAQNNGLNQPKPGEVVWVTFEDIENLEQGIFLGGLKEGQISSDATAALTAQQAFDACGKPVFGARAAGGLALKKINVNIVGNFPDLKNVRTPIDINKERGTLPVGKGLFTNLSPSRGGRYPLQKAVEAGLDWVAVLGLWQRWPSVNAKGKKDTVADKEKLRSFVKAYSDAGIKVYLWAFPNFKKLDELVSFIFPLAYETGCVGVIYDPEDGILGKYSVEESVRTAKNWMDKSMQAARRYGLCCGVSSYEIPHWIHPNLMPMLGAMADAGCDFVIPQSYRAKAKYKPKGMYRGLKDYKDAGFKNILAMGGNYGKGYEAMYPQYGSTQKPPEEIVRRNGWLLGETAQKYIDYKKAFGMWRWESNNVIAAGWPQNRWVTLKHLGDEIEKNKSGNSATNQPMTKAEKELSDASAAEKSVNVDKVTENVKNSEVQGAAAAASDTIKQSDESNETKNVKQPPKLSKQQEEGLNSLRALYASKKKEVEEVELQIEGMTSTALKGSPAHAAAEKLKPQLANKKHELGSVEKALRKYEKKLGILTKTAAPSPLKPLSTTPSNSTGCGTSNNKAAKAGNFVPSNIGFSEAKEYLYDNTVVDIQPSTAYTENRVRNGSFIQKFLKPELIVSYRGRNVHKLAAKRIEMMNKAWVKDTGRAPFQLASGLREPGEARYKWLRGARGSRVSPRVKAQLQKDPNTSTPVLFDLWLIDRYGSVKTGRKYRAFNSAHETGLAFDISYGNASPEKWKDGSMGPYSATNNKQKQGQLFKWLKKNAHKYGIFPYKGEAWHWEIQLTRKAWYTGEDFVTDGNYAVNVLEKSTKSNRLTNDVWWAGREFK